MTVDQAAVSADVDAPENPTDPADATAGTADRDRGSDRSRLMPAVGFALLSLVLSGRYLLSGVGYVLDDWFALGHAHFDGAWSAAGPEQWVARPGVGVLYAFVFGTLGGHPGAAFAILAVINAATAVCFWLLLRRFLPARISVVATLAWIVLPNHTSLEVWISATNIAVAVLLVLAGALVLLTPTWSRRIIAAACFVIASLSYEAVMPIVALLTVGLPWLERRRPDIRLIVTVALSQLLVLAWILTHWHPAKAIREAADFSQVPAAHLGWGVLPAGPVANVALAAALVILFVPLGRLIVRRDQCGPADWIVPVGVVVIVAGVLPFARYFYAPLGAGDRFSFVSAFGGALLWAAIFDVCWRVRREFAVGAFAVVFGLALVARSERAQQWSDAAHDAEAIRMLVVAEVPDPDGVDIVIGPVIQVDNVAAYLDPSNIEPAVRLAYDDPTVSARLSNDAVTPDGEGHIDALPVLRLGRTCPRILEFLDSCPLRREP